MTCIFDRETYTRRLEKEIATLQQEMKDERVSVRVLQEEHRERVEQTNAIKKEHSNEVNSFLRKLSELQKQLKPHRFTSPELVIDDVTPLPIPFLRGIEDTKWAGRSQRVPLEGHNITFFLDGAHTVESMDVCKNWFSECTTKENSNNKRPIRVLVFYCSGTRDPSRLIQPLTTTANINTNNVNINTNNTSNNNTGNNENITSF